MEQEPSTAGGQRHPRRAPRLRRAVERCRLAVDEHLLEPQPERHCQRDLVSAPILDVEAGLALDEPRLVTPRGGDLPPCPGPCLGRVGRHQLRGRRIVGPAQHRLGRAIREFRHDGRRRLLVRRRPFREAVADDAGATAATTAADQKRAVGGVGPFHPGQRRGHGAGEGDHAAGAKRDGRLYGRTKLDQPGVLNHREPCLIPPLRFRTLQPPREERARCGLDQRPLHGVAQRFREVDHDRVDRSGVGPAGETERLRQPAVAGDELHERLGIERRPAADEPCLTIGHAVATEEATAGRARLLERGKPCLGRQDADRLPRDLDHGLGPDAVVDQRRIGRLPLQPHHVHVGGRKLASERNAAAMAGDPQAERAARRRGFGQLDPQFAAAARPHDPPLHRPAGIDQGLHRPVTRAVIGAVSGAGWLPLDGLDGIDEPFLGDLCRDCERLARRHPYVACRASEHGAG